MELVRTSETSVDNHFTRQYNPEDNSEHHTRRRENLKSHNVAPSVAMRAIYMTAVTLRITTRLRSEYSCSDSKTALRIKYYGLKYRIPTRGPLVSFVQPAYIF
jgi:hypothetical protein